MESTTVIENDESEAILQENANGEIVHPDVPDIVADAPIFTSIKYSFIEPAILLLFFAYSLSGTIFQNLLLYQTCTDVFQYNASDCILLGTENATDEIKEIETVVELYVANILMARIILESIFPALLSLFLGSWSDKFGRRPVLLSTYLGFCLIYSLIGLITYLSSFMQINPWFYLLAFVPVSISGGTCALITSTFCYIADVSTNKNRALRMSYLEAALFVGLLFGSLSSSYVYKLTSTIAIFGISAASTFIGLVYIFFFIHESIQQTAEVGCLTKLAAIFDFSLIVDMMKTCFKPRANYNRAIIWLVITSLAASIFVLEGSTTVFYLYIREQFQWTIQQYTLYDAANILIQILGNIIGMYVLNSILGFSETALAIIAYLSSFGDYTIKALAIHPWHLYVGSSIAILRGIYSPMCRAILSNIVPSNEIGKIYALTTSIESLTPLASAPLYSLVYSYTLNVYPGAFNIISAIVFLLCVVLLIFVHIFKKRQSTIAYGIVGNYDENS